MVSIAIAIGGLWAAFQFFTVMLPQLRKELFTQAQVNIKVTAHEEHLAEGSRGLVAVVDITNNGGRNVLLDYRDQPLTVKRASLTAKEPLEERYIDKTDYLPTGWQYRVLRSGETDELVYVVRIREAGLYNVEFQVSLPPKELEEHDKVVAEAAKELGVAAPARKQEQKIWWHGSAVVNVGPALKR
jgi:hypothetical protein